MAKMKLSEELKWRGFVYQNTYKDASALDKEPIKFYLGVDPSAPSMTVGNLSTIMMVKTFIRHGHKAYMLVGGATGLIGDPDGKSEERDLKAVKEIEDNKKAIKAEYEGILKGELKNGQVEIVDNAVWFENVKFIDFLRDVGKHVPMRQMLARDFVQTRLKEDGTGISYAEFSYSLMQAYDFYKLFTEKSVTLQICGSDQWGNCVAGVDLIRRKTGKEAHIWSHPLMIDKSTSIKFGKSETGAIWLEASLTSVYKFYQFWLNVDDEGVEDYLKIYTLISKEELERLMADFNSDRSNRAAQKYLAYEVTKIVHGQDHADKVRRETEVLFGKQGLGSLTESEYKELGEEIGKFKVNNGADLAEVLVKAGLATSKGEARRFLESNAIYINGSQIPLSKTKLGTEDSNNGYIILRRGKNSQVLIHIS
jgi:tyrosyl-tRNA synthetase